MVIISKIKEYRRAKLELGAPRLNSSFALKPKAPHLVRYHEMELKDRGELNIKIKEPSWSMAFPAKKMPVGFVTS
jgi:hypothetical protein